MLMRIIAHPKVNKQKRGTMGQLKVQHAAQMKKIIIILAVRLILEGWAKMARLISP